MRLVQQQATPSAEEKEPAAPPKRDRGSAASRARRVGGVLLIYHRPTVPWAFVDASNVDENIAAFTRHSRFPVWGVNTDFGFRRGLPKLEFDAIVVHYSVFIWSQQGYLLGNELLEYLGAARGYKIAFFQDEHHWCKQRFGFIDEYGIDCVYTLLEPPHAEQVYGSHTNASKFVSHFPSYVGQELLDAAPRFGKPDRERQIDIGYRGREIPPYMGRGGLEKAVIGERFAELAQNRGLRLDVKVSEGERIYGDDWHRFMADCKGTLGTESGVSCFDLEDEVREEYERLSAGGREVTVEKLERGALGRWDGKIPYRTISPRNFEAAAFRVCQVLFEGRYSGLMEPMHHYIPLRKDFSNLDEVIERFKDPGLRQELTENAHRDLIASGENSYERLIASLDATLREAGLQPHRSAAEKQEVSRMLRRTLGERWRFYENTRLSWLYVYHPLIWRLAFTVLHPLKVLSYGVGKLLRRDQAD
jgi:hypothetical protein